MQGKKCTHFTQAASYNYKPSASRAPTMTDPSAFCSLALSTTTPSLSPRRLPVSSRQPSATGSFVRFRLARGPAATSASTVVIQSLPSRTGGVLAGCGLRVAGCGLRGAGCGLRVAGCGALDSIFPSPLLLGLNRGGVYAGVAPRVARRSTAVADDLAQSNSRLLSAARWEHCVEGHAGHGEFGSLGTCSLSSWTV